MYAQKAIVHNAPTLHTVRNVHNAHCAYRFKVQSCDCINFVRAIDPSIGTAALGIGPNDLMNDLKTIGLLFENLCVRDLRIYSEALDGEIYHFRDKTGLECDIVMHLRNGKYGLIEVKLGGDTLIKEGAKNLLKLKNKIDTTKMKEPSFLMILCAKIPFAYKRKDGIIVCPICCLKP